MFADWLAAAAGARSARIDRAVLLEGGAVQQNWALDVTFVGGRYEDRRALVLRANFQTSLPASRSKADEFAMLRRVYAAGVCVPEPLFLCNDVGVIGTPFFVMRRLPGAAARTQLLAAAMRDGFGQALGADLARELARIHTIPASRLEGENAALRLVAEYRDWLSELPETGLVPARALDWLVSNAPDRPVASIVHRDFRTGNFLVEDGHLTGILDWEFAGPGDPAEDIGWLCARCWRGGAEACEAGGLTTRAAFLASYEAAGGVCIPGEVIAYWEVSAHVRWSLIARQQAMRAAAGDAPQHELVEAAGRITGLDEAIENLLAANV